MTDMNKINFNTIRIYFMKEIHKSKEAMDFLKYLSFSIVLILDEMKFRQMNIIFSLSS